MNALQLLVPASPLAARPDARALLTELPAALGMALNVRESARYDDMERELLAGTAHLGWAPPLVYARVEAYGGRLLARAIRNGSAAYRSALLLRRGSGVELRAGAGLRAAWVDRESVAGFVLPQVVLRDRGLRGWEVFAEERFVGSYRAAFDAVMDGSADLCSAPVHAGTVAAARREVELQAGPGLDVLALSGACANDGIVAGPRLGEAQLESVRRAVLGLHHVTRARRLLERLFEAERFELAPEASYREIYALLLAALPGRAPTARGLQRVFRSARSG
ncbi:MAG: PhnD/SsuA/transferrin family substrate-binding protein [Deltaproteobacteria bacterium]|nr:PhnD/SsuA/transferrin family substrate-binding protein [Deltaproteobacteria bacterium]